jgi:hypothetical protein
VCEKPLVKGCDGIRPPAMPDGWAQVLSMFPPAKKAIGTRSEKRSGHDVRGSFLSACGVPLFLTPPEPDVRRLRPHFSNTGQHLSFRKVLPYLRRKGRTEPPIFSGGKRVLGRSGGEGKFLKVFPAFLPAGYHDFITRMRLPGGKHTRLKS